MRVRETYVLLNLIKHQRPDIDKIKWGVLIVFHDMIADLESNKRLTPIVTELFLRGRKLNILLVFISQSYFKKPNTIRLNAKHFFFMKIPNKRELLQIAPNHSSSIHFKNLMKLYIKIILKNCIRF